MTVSVALDGGYVVSDAAYEPVCREFARHAGPADAGRSWDDVLATGRTMQAERRT